MSSSINILFCKNNIKIGSSPGKWKLDFDEAGQVVIQKVDQSFFYVFYYYLILKPFMVLASCFNRKWTATQRLSPKVERLADKISVLLETQGFQAAESSFHTDLKKWKICKENLEQLSEKSCLSSNGRFRIAIILGLIEAKCSEAKSAYDKQANSNDELLELPLALLSKEEIENHAATRIQTQFRACAVRHSQCLKKLKSETHAAKVLQTSARMHRVQRQFQGILEFNKAFSWIFSGVLTSPKSLFKDFSVQAAGLVPLAFGYEEYEKAGWLLTLVDKVQAKKLIQEEINRSQKSQSTLEYLEWLSLFIENRTETHTIDKDQLDLFAINLGLGYKTANLMVMASQLSKISKELKGCDVEVPPLEHVSDSQSWFFLARHFSELLPLWKAFLDSFPPDSKKIFIEADPSQAKCVNLQISPAGESILAAIQEKIKDTYAENFFKTPFIAAWLHQNPSEYVIVRSTGKEDSDNSANAGGNDSVPFVPANEKDISSAMGLVIASYFGIKSLTQRLQNGDQSIFSERPFLPVLVQTIICETTQAKPDSDEYLFTRSGVLFTQEQGKANVVTINAAYGSNEGVVTSQVPVDTYLATKDTVYSIVREKSHRFKQVKKQNASKLVMSSVKNPLKVQRQSTLTMPMVRDLYAIAITLGKMYGQGGSVKPMDMEYTILSNAGKRPTIYLLQIRPLAKPDEWVKKPSFLDFSRLKEEGEELGWQQLKVFQMGSPYLRLITDSANEVVVADDLPGALKQYQACKDVQAIKLILIKKTAPVTSHEAVTLRPTNIPIFVMNSPQEEGKVERLIYGATKSAPVVVCPQRGVVGKQGPAVQEKEGLITYPCDREFSLAPPGLAKFEFPFKRMNAQQKKDRCKTLCFQISQSIREWMVPESFVFPQYLDKKGRIQELFEHLALKPKMEAKKALAELFYYLVRCTYSYQEKIMSSAFQQDMFDDLFLALDQAYSIAKNQVVPLLEKEEESVRLDLLFHLKQIEALTFQSYQENVVNPVSFGVFLRQWNASSLLEGECKFLNIPVNQGNVYLLSLKNSIYSDEAQRKWTELVQKMNELKDPAATIHALIKMFFQLNGLGLLDVWLNTAFVEYCDQMSSSLSPLSDFEQLVLKAVSYSTAFSAINDGLKAIEHSPESWSNPLHAAKQTSKLVEDVKNLCKNLSNVFNTAKDSFERQAVLVSMRRLLSGYDILIKQVTGSGEYVGAAGRRTQAGNFLALVDNYFKLLETCTEWASPFEIELMGVNQGLLTKFSAYLSYLRSGHTYKFGFAPGMITSVGLDTIRYRFSQMTDSEIDTLFFARPSFNVAALAIGSHSDLNFSAHWPKSLEEHFTTIHQSCEALLDYLQTFYGFNEKILPDRVKSLLGCYTAALGKFSSIGVKEESIEIHFKIPLRQHSGSVVILVPRASKKPLQLSVSAFGNEEHDRWKAFAAYGAILVARLGLQFQSDVPPVINYVNPTGVSFTVVLPSNMPESTDKNQLLSESLQFMFKVFTMGQFQSVQGLKEAFQSSNVLLKFNLLEPKDWVQLPSEVYSQSLIMNAWAMESADSQMNYDKLCDIAEATLHGLARYGVKSAINTIQVKALPQLIEHFVPSQMTQPEFNDLFSGKNLVDLAFLYLIKAVQKAPELNCKVRTMISSPLLAQKFPQEIQKALSLTISPEEQFDKVIQDPNTLHIALRLASSFHSSDKKRELVIKQVLIILDTPEKFINLMKNFFQSTSASNLNIIRDLIELLKNQPLQMRVLFSGLLTAFQEITDNVIKEKLLEFLSSDFINQWLSPDQKQSLNHIKKLEKNQKKHQALLNEISKNYLHTLSRFIQALHANILSCDTDQSLQDIQTIICGLMLQSAPLTSVFYVSLNSTNPVIGSYLNHPEYKYFQDNIYSDTTKVHKAVSFALLRFLEDDSQPNVQKEALQALQGVIAFYIRINKSQYPRTVDIQNLLFSLTRAVINKMEKAGEDSKAISNMILSLWGYENPVLINALFNYSVEGSQLLVSDKFKASMSPFSYEFHKENKLFTGPIPIILRRREFTNYLIKNAVSFLSEEEMEESQIPKFYEEKQIRCHSFPILDFWIPSSVEEARLFIENKILPLFDEGNVYVHCKGGKGRTGTMVACMMAYVYAKNGKYEDLSAEKIFDYVRKQISGAIETKVQEEFVEDFIKSLRT